MPVYKIMPEDRGKRVLVTGSNLDEVISKGRKKLNLPDGSYKVHSYAVNQFLLIHVVCRDVLRNWCQIRDELLK